MCPTCPTGPNLIAFFFLHKTERNIKRLNFILRWKFLSVFTTLLIRMNTNDIL